MNREEREHDFMLTKAMNHPHLVGLKDIVVAAKEVNVFNADGTLRRKPDLVFIDSYGVVSIGEYQLHGTHKERAYHQLNDTGEALYTAFGLEPNKMYIHDTFEVRNFGKRNVR